MKCPHCGNDAFRACLAEQKANVWAVFDAKGALRDIDYMESEATFALQGDCFCMECGGKVSCRVETDTHFNDFPRLVFKETHATAQ